MAKPEQRNRLGTASWTDPTLIKSDRFYLKDSSSAEASLHFYVLPLVEVNAKKVSRPLRRS